MMRKGFSLIEVLVVISILSVASGILLVSFFSAQGEVVLEGAQATAVHALENARSRALSGSGEGGDHGVRIMEDEIIVFTGDDFDSGTVQYTVPLPRSVTSDQSERDIVFKRITGLPNIGSGEDVSITLRKNSGEEVTVVVTDSGSIKGAQ